MSPLAQRGRPSGMPRIRSLKPEIWQDESIGRLSSWERLLFIGLITMADDEGRLRALPRLILGHVFPHDRISEARLRRWLLNLHREGLIVVYEHADFTYAHVVNFTRHQKIDKPSPSTLPAPGANGNGRLL